MVVSQPTFQDHYVDLRAGNGRQRMREKLSEDGIVTFDAAQSRADLVAMAADLGPIFMHRDSEADGVTRVSSTEEAARAGYLGLTSSELVLHTDRSGAPNPPTWVVIYCNRPSARGGDSRLCDGRAVFQALQREDPAGLERLCQPGLCVFGGAEVLLPAAVFNRNPDGSYALRFRGDDLGYFSSSLREVLPALYSTIDKLVFTIKLAMGQGYIVQNQRWFHGRTEFQGEREMYRLLVGPANGTGARGFTP